MGLVFVNNREAVREVERLAGRQVRLQFGPHLFLACIGEQILNDRPLFCCFFRIEERLAGHPAILQTEVVGLAPLALANDHVDAIVPHILRLATALDAVADHGHDFVTEDLLDTIRRVVGTLNSGFVDVIQRRLFHGQLQG